VGELLVEDVRHLELVDEESESFGAMPELIGCERESGR
jgi:hypothetical protein